MLYIRIKELPSPAFEEIGFAHQTIEERHIPLHFPFDLDKIVAMWRERIYSDRTLADWIHT